MCYFIFHTASSAARSLDPLCRRMLVLNPALLRLWHWQSGALTTRLNLIHQNKIIIFLLSLGPHRLKKIRIFQPCIKYSTYCTYFCGYVVPSAVTSCCPLLQNQETQEKSSPQSHHLGTAALSPPRIPAFLGLTILKLIYKKYSASWSHLRVPTCRKRPYTYFLGHRSGASITLTKTCIHGNVSREESIFRRLKIKIKSVPVLPVFALTVKFLLKPFCREN